MRIARLTICEQNTALYSTFAVFGFFGGTFVNRLGVKVTLAFGGIGYCIYAISLLVSVSHNVGGFNIFAGALLGVCAGLLWTAQGTIMISYPHEGSKGRYFAWFWAIFNLGGVVGSLVSISPIFRWHRFCLSAGLIILISKKSRDLTHFLCSATFISSSADIPPDPARPEHRC
jgi:MFS family permease